MKKKLFAVMVACLVTFALAAGGNTGNGIEHEQEAMQCNI